ncbi:hypothetical protein FOL47_009191 [Perkinsus chesapeaki]|uniref:Peptidase C1A papain C-terminal domain-containing protein n=1 Tax=Perkinsus chesapeaki TaxID=330153 RepID=A0A7J6LA07_PERCH|nr:hypothetical protein FOL47_009191 [Perkinsus chesapeaki]
MLAAVQNNGPVSVAIEADHPVFKYYEGGVIDDPGCGVMLNHAALVVGYVMSNSSAKDASYFIVKNSWGDGWGEEGYFRIALNGPITGNTFVEHAFTSECRFTAAPRMWFV